jgi:hypothetical protein
LFSFCTVYSPVQIEDTKGVKVKVYSVVQIEENKEGKYEGGGVLLLVIPGVM